MASTCATYWLVRAPTAAHARGALHSRTSFSSRVVPLLRLRLQRSCKGFNLRASVKPESETENEASEAPEKAVPDVKVDFEKDISKVVRKTAATFAPRASSAKNKNPAQPGTTLYSIFEIQAYISMAVGGILSFNLLFPSDHPDIWRLMGMWSVWMFTIPSLRARDCPAKEKEALNYLFLAVPLINVTLPLVWKSFAAVWSADVLAFVAMYAWKLEWLGGSDNKADGSEQ
ncbi:hypothetical protein KC19_12G170700 [Ceratodon purpureus]|uniref:Uncharacterized protein n=1 Tax=Ceratodon purpureus TaxID=3225 RepID=A0A8T0GE26_CERPU|nr:hypothetical protein KC19_12G170700 [Ceratodon purpureus]